MDKIIAQLNRARLASAGHMSTRFKEYPMKNRAWVEHRYDGEVVNPKTGKKILCFVCRRNIKVELNMEREFVRPSGKRRKQIWDQPHPVYLNKGKRFVLQHINCTPDSWFNDEYTDDETWLEEEGQHHSSDDHSSDADEECKSCQKPMGGAEMSEDPAQSVVTDRGHSPLSRT